MFHIHTHLVTTFLARESVNLGTAESKLHAECPHHVAFGSYGPRLDEPP